MFSNIQSMFFGKKHHNTAADDSAVDKNASLENDYVFVERRHSTQPGIDAAMYPALNLSNPLNLPYAVSPSLPNLAQPVMYERSQKQETATIPDNKDMLSGVPFTLSSHFKTCNRDNDYVLTDLIHRKDEVSPESVVNCFEYNFSLENRILQEMESYNP